MYIFKIINTILCQHIAALSCLFMSCLLLFVHERNLALEKRSQKKHNFVTQA